jgi:centrosomal CEP192-like protein
MSHWYNSKKSGIPPLLFIVSVFWICACDDSRLNQGKPQIEVLPETVTFKTLNIGEQDIQTLTIKNIGNAALQIESVSLSGDPVFKLENWDADDFSAVSFPHGVPQPGGLNPSSRELTISFSPDLNGEYSGSIEIVSNDEDDETVTIALVGISSIPNIIVDPPLLDFAGVGLNSSSSLGLTVKNEWPPDLPDPPDLSVLIVPADQIALLSGDPDSPFIWMASDMQIAGNQQSMMQVLYSPKKVNLDPDTHEAIPDEDTLLIYSNDPDENPIEVELRGYVDDNFPPLVAIKITETLKLDGTPLVDPCAIATSDTTKFEAVVIDPEGDFLQSSNLTWVIEEKPLGSQRQMTVPVDDAFHPSFKPDMYGAYKICLRASDPQGNQSSYDVDESCECSQANAKPDGVFDCQCIHFTAFPREDIRVELTWENIGPDLDLHLVAPAGDYCSSTRECRFNPIEEDPEWDRFACVDTGSITTCRTPNCNPVAAGCLAQQECFDDDDAGPNPPACWWRRCSGSDCYWDSRNPDWGVLGDELDDPLLAIDCTHSCRAENINLNNPEPGIYQIMVNYFEYAGDTNATVRIFFKGDLAPSAEYTSVMTKDCDTWNVALLTWVDPEDHTVTYLDGNHSDRCCQ